MKTDTTHILLVDDDQDDKMFFEDVLDELDIATNFEHCPNGPEALRRLADGKGQLPDIVFLDLNMPIMSGEECLERIRANRILKSVKVVIYSTSYNPETADMLYEKGADYYLRKPATYEKLKQAILKAIESLERDGKEPVAKCDYVINS